MGYLDGTGAFPGANTTFTVKRKVITKTSGNPTGITYNVITTGLSATLQDLQGMIADSKGGLMFSGAYRASTFLDAPVQIGDMLYDENDTDPDGTATEYEVQGRTYGAVAMLVHLRRTLAGV